MAERIVLRKGLGKDGDSGVQYIRDFPTHYEWVARVSRRAHQLVNAEDFREKIWVNSYVKHPPAFPREHLSLDVWGSGGRGDPIGEDLGHRVYDRLFNNPHAPDVWWCIWQNRMYVRDPRTFEEEFRSAPPGPPGSDPKHELHLHVSYFEWEPQARFRGWDLS
jgi:hypothetical protein